MAGRTRAEQKRQTRERLLDAAEPLFLEHGYADTPMEQIAQDAGVTKGAIYRHFESKEDLFLALRQRGSRLADVSPLEDGSLALDERLAEVGRRVARMTVDSDPRRLALLLEFRAISLRRSDARERFADELRALIAAAAESEWPEGVPGPREGVTEAEVLILSQLLIEGLVEYRAFVPEIVTEETFASALAALAHLTADGG